MCFNIVKPLLQIAMHVLHLVTDPWQASFDHPCQADGFAAPALAAALGASACAAARRQTRGARGPVRRRCWTWTMAPRKTINSPLQSLYTFWILLAGSICNGVRVIIQIVSSCHVLVMFLPFRLQRRLDRASIDAQ